MNEAMNEKEQVAALMDKYIDLQRIKTAADRDGEIEYQIRTTKAKLEAIGVAAIVTELMNKYVDLQRIKTAADRDGEISYQIRTTKTKLKALGIAAENLDK